MARQDDEGHEGDVRIVNEYSNITGTGRVEIFHNNKWGTICDHYWDVIDATVVCKELGFRRASRAPGRAFFGPGDTNQPIWLNRVNCTEEEGEQLTDCVSSGWENNDCSHWEDAGVICSNYTAQEGELRLIDGKNESIGRVEIYHDEAWGTICQNGWGYNESTVVCHQLGYPHASYQTRYFGPGDVPVMFSDMDCTGLESYLLDCRHVFSRETDCNQTDVVGVACFYDSIPDAEEATMVLWLIVVIVISCIIGCGLIIVIIGLVYRSQQHSSNTGSSREDPPPPYTEENITGSPPEKGYVA